MVKVNVNFMKSYLGDDPIRNSLQFVHEYDGHYYASNGWCAIKVPAEKCGTIKDLLPAPEQEPTGPKGKEIAMVFDKVIQAGKPKTIFLTQLKKAFDKFKKEPVYEDCPECDGDGYGECDCCGNVYKCKECMGTGQGPATGETQLENKDLKFKSPPDWDRPYDLVYNPNFVYKYLYMPLKELGVETFKWLGGKDNKTGLFEAEGIFIIIMARTPLSSEGKEITINPL